MKFKWILKNEIEHLPNKVGVYCFKSKEEILYIGKAGNVQERVKNHFQQLGFKESFFWIEQRK